MGSLDQHEVDAIFEDLIWEPEHHDPRDDPYVNDLIALLHRHGFGAQRRLNYSLHAMGHLVREYGIEPADVEGIMEDIEDRYQQEQRNGQA